MHHFHVRGLLVLSGVLVSGVTLAMFQPSAYAQANTPMVTTTTTTTTTTTQLPPPSDLPKASEAFVADGGRAARVAVYIRNRGGVKLDDAALALEGLVSSAVAQAGLQVVSRQDVLASVSRLSQAGDHAAAAQGRHGVQNADLLLEQSASAVRLAQMMSADYLLMVNLTEQGKKTQALNRPDLGISRSVTTHKLLGSFYVADAAYGATLYGGALKATHRTSATGDGTFVEKDDTVQAELLQVAAQQIAGGLGGVVIKSLPTRGQVTFEVACGVSDLSIPDVVKNDAGDWVVTDTQYELVPVGVTVELDGIALGSTPGTFTASPGLHRLRVTREGFKPWERMINLAANQGSPLRLHVALSMTNDGINRMKDLRAWLDGAQRGKILTDADVKVLEGFADLLRDTKINLDTSGIRSIGERQSVLEIDSFFRELKQD